MSVTIYSGEKGSRDVRGRTLTIASDIAVVSPVVFPLRSLSRTTCEDIPFPTVSGENPIPFLKVHLSLS